jgi:prolipoprotein diacylglyceryltransferase
MANENDVDDLIREALRAEDAADIAKFGEPGMPDMALAVFRGRLRWYGILFAAITLVFAILAAYCAVRFQGTSDVPTMLRWGAGFFVCVLVVLSGKIWYWLQMEHFAMTREMKRVELLIAHLATELRGRR